MARKVVAPALPATTSITNYFSAGSVNAASLTASTVTNSLQVLSGALTADILATLLNVSGSGEVHYLVAYAIDTTSRTVRIKVTVDGVAVFDATSSAVTAAGSGLVVAGSAPSTSAVVFGPIRYNSSFKVEVASSLSETDKVAIAYNIVKS